ncbi:MAG: DUF4328 domain-containing protein [Verrucomicrobiota bacterium]
MDADSNPYQAPAADPAPDSAATDPAVMNDPRPRGWLAIACISLVSVGGIAHAFLPRDFRWLEGWNTGTVLTAFASIVAYLFWIHLCAKNTLLKNRRADVKPGWVVACHFIPFVNWFAPCLALREISRETFKHRPAKGMDAIIIVWWVALLTRSVSAKWADSLSIAVLWIAATVISWFAVAFIIIRISRTQAAFRWSDLPALNRPVMVPIGSSAQPLGGIPSGSGRPLPPVRRVLRPLPPREKIDD